MTKIQRSKNALFKIWKFKVSDKIGFTLTEILIVVAIIALLSSMALVSFVNSRNIREVATSGQNVMSILRLAQSKALGGEDNSAWGVHLEQNQTVLFSGDTYAGATFTEDYPLPDSLEIADINLAGGGNDIIFKRLTGRTDEYGDFEVRVISATSVSFSITQNISGKVYQTGTAPAPSGSRLTDTRHRSFNLGWSLQGYNTMTLTFSDPPNPDTVENVDMAGFFQGTTKYDWTGTFTIGGRDQTMRIHTTSLDGANTVLSVDRDCRFNDKKVEIKFNTREVATYEANCTGLTVEAYGGTMSEP